MVISHEHSASSPCRVQALPGPQSRQRLSIQALCECRSAAEQNRCIFAEVLQQNVPDLVATHTHAVKWLGGLPLQYELHVLQVCVHGYVHACKGKIAL